METGFMNRITGLVIALVVGGLLVGGLLIPTVQGMTETEKTQINEGANYALYELGDTHTITFTADSMITDGVAQPLPDTSLYGSATIVYGSGIFRYHSDGHIRFWGVFQSGDVQRDLGLAVNATLTIDEAGTCLGTSTDSSVIVREFSATKMYPQPTGNYALTYQPYVNDDSEIYGCGNTTVNNTIYTLSWYGTKDNVSIEWTYPPDQTIGDIVINTTNPKTDLFKISSVVIPNETAGQDFTYNYFFAPKEVSYRNPLQLDATQIAMFGVISILGIVALVVVAANGIRNKY